MCLPIADPLLLSSNIPSRLAFEKTDHAVPLVRRHTVALNRVGRRSNFVLTVIVREGWQRVPKVPSPLARKLTVPGVFMQEPLHYKGD